jgi:hypothetical protein
MRTKLLHCGVIAGAFFVGLGAPACATKTSVTQVWQAPTQGPVRAPMRAVLVFGVRSEESTRRILEDEVVAALARNGVRSAPSYAVFVGDATPPIDQARKMVDEQHFEGVLVLKLQDIKEEQHYVPPAGHFWNGYYGYGWGWGGYTSPGYMATDEIVTFETTLWDLRGDDRLVWTAQTQTTNPRSGHDFARSLSKAVIPALTKARWLPPKIDED